MITGLLYSQVGYESSLPVRIVVRSTQATFIQDGATCHLHHDSHTSQTTSLKKWGLLWGSHWWIAEFPANLPLGQWSISVQNDCFVLMQADHLTIGNGILWDSTVLYMSVEMLECRQVMAKASCGWMDAGAMWQESNAQSSMIIGLLDLIEHAAERLEPSVIERVYKQIINGCEYLVRTQQEAEKLGYPTGAMSHDVIGHEHDILPNDANKAVVALHRSASLLPSIYITEKQRFAAAAEKALNWLSESAQPLGDLGLCRQQRGLAEDARIPKDEWTTRDLVMTTWAALESALAGNNKSKEFCINTAQQIMARQIQQNDAEAGYHGHFREYESLMHSEKSWTHSISNGNFGTDAGGSFPHYLLPLIKMLKSWPKHPDAEAWEQTLKNFTFGFLIPGCHANPFYIIPQGIFEKEGPLWFTCTFHGMNAIYGLTAALALELHALFPDPRLLAIAYGNLQWIAGLNAGLTQSAVDTGSVVFRTTIDPTLALPVSMIHGVGSRTAGTWFGTRGVVCNGFATGKQFEFDVAPLKVNDGPYSFTDEDWIPHSAAWLSGLSRLQKLLPNF